MDGPYIAWAPPTMPMLYFVPKGRSDAGFVGIPARMCPLSRVFSVLRHFAADSQQTAGHVVCCCANATLKAGKAGKLTLTYFVGAVWIHSLDRIAN